MFDPSVTSQLSLSFILLQNSTSMTKNRGVRTCLLNRRLCLTRLWKQAGWEVQSKINSGYQLQTEGISESSLCRTLFCTFLIRHLSFKKVTTQQACCLGIKTETRGWPVHQYWHSMCEIFNHSQCQRTLKQCNTLRTFDSRLLSSCFIMALSSSTHAVHTQSILLSLLLQVHVPQKYQGPHPTNCHI